MNTKDLFKKYGFVMIVGLALLIFIGVYAIDSISKVEKKVDTKQVDGQYVLYSVDDANYMADELYDTLYKGVGPATSLGALKRSVIDQAVKSTSDMEDQAANYAAYMIQYYGEEQILSYLKQQGYESIDDLQKMYIDSLKETQFVSEYYTAHYDEYVKDVVEEQNARKIYHILVKVADVEETTDEEGNTVHVAHPTEEESSKLASVLEALKTSDFQSVAKEYSEDGSAANGGLLGVVGAYNSSNYVPEFAAESMKIKAGETSEVITTTYGYHILYCEEASLEELLADTEFLSQIDTVHPEAYYRAIKEKADELGFTVNDQDLIDALNGGTESEEK